MFLCFMDFPDRLPVPFPCFSQDRWKQWQRGTICAPLVIFASQVLRGEHLYIPPRRTKNQELRTTYPRRWCLIPNLSQLRIREIVPSYLLKVVAAVSTGFCTPLAHSNSMAEATTRKGYSITFYRYIAPLSGS